MPRSLVSIFRPIGLIFGLTSLWPLTACSAIDSALPIYPESHSGVFDEGGIGPLDEFQVRISGFPLDATIEERQLQSDANHRAIEEWIAVCMARQGFTYIPNLSAAPIAHSIGEEVPVDRGTREFAEQFGYGIADMILDPEIILTVSGGNDPNYDATTGMSSTELAAWQSALWGEGGCSQSAMREFWRPESFVLLSDAINDLSRRISDESTPELVQLNSEWATCMLNAGFPDSGTPRALERRLREEFAELQGLRVHRDGTIEGIAQTPTPEAVSAFRQREIAAAISDVECSMQMAYRQRHQRIIVSLQQDFVDQHQHELQAWAEHAEQLRTRD